MSTLQLLKKKVTKAQIFEEIAYKHLFQWFLHRFCVIKQVPVNMFRTKFLMFFLFSKRININDNANTIRSQEVKTKKKNNSKVAFLHAFSQQIPCLFLTIFQVQGKTALKYQFALRFFFPILLRLSSKLLYATESTIFQFPYVPIPNSKAGGCLNSFPTTAHNVYFSNRSRASVPLVTDICAVSSVHCQFPSICLWCV